MLHTVLNFVLALACFSMAHYLDIHNPYSLWVLVPMSALFTIGIVFTAITCVCACGWLLDEPKKRRKTRA